MEAYPLAIGEGEWMLYDTQIFPISNVFGVFLIRRRRSNYASLVQREVAPQGDGGIVKVRIMQDIKQPDKYPYSLRLDLG